jgi:erythromycin esterase-like protein
MAVSRPVTTANILTETIREFAHPLTGAASDFDPLLDMIGDAHFVLIGEASHGTHNFYERRAEITKRLITEKGFTVVAVEADWPDAYRINRYVRALDDIASANDALSDFKRFPSWMWRNTVVRDFVEWLRKHNDSLPQNARKTGFYGLDLYSLYSSMEAVLNYLDKTDPEAAQRARKRYACFDQFGEDTQAYGYATGFGFTPSCEKAVVEELVDIQKRLGEKVKREGPQAEEEYFFAEENARVVKDAEEYYRTMFEGRVSSWNLRDRHMVNTLNDLVAFLDRSGGKGSTRAVVWEHNSHLGDARATSMGTDGEWNVGQLVREKYGRDSVLVGFTTYTGTVTCASDWDEPTERKRVRPALQGSYELLFHETNMPRFLLTMRDNHTLSAALHGPRLERAIGVIYLPQTERISHYFNARLPEQFDAVIHLDETRALEPLDRTSLWETGEVEETFPTGL